MPKNKKRQKNPNPASTAEPAPRVAINRSTKNTMVGIAVMIALVGWLIIGSGPEDVSISVNVPTLSATAAQGQQTFRQVCANCHGDNANGSSVGPPLVHAFYRPGHHADGAIRNAIATGVRQHHWQFGPMPPQPKIKVSEINPLIAYIREMQQANGIN